MKSKWTFIDTKVFSRMHLLFDFSSFSWPYFGQSLKKFDSVKDIFWTPGRSTQAPLFDKVYHYIAI